MTHWHLLQFKPNAHRLAERNLKRQGFATFLPMHETTRRKASRFVSNISPLFPGYMFVGVNEGETPWRQINYTLGVSRMVNLEGDPRPIPKQVISNLMLRCDTSGKLLAPKSLKVGDCVEVLTGPFADFVAKIENIEAQQRISILIEFLGQKTKMLVKPEQVKLTNEFCD